MKRWRLCVGTVLLGAAGTLGAAGPISGGTVKVAVLTSMSGLYSDIGGPGSVTAAQMAVEDFRAEAKPSFNIEVVHADHKNRADIGANQVREWIDRDGVDMITDAVNSAVAIESAKVAAEKRRIFINTGAASTRLTNENCSAYTIHHTYDTYALASGTGRGVVKQGGDSWFFITADYFFGHGLEQDTAGYVKASGGKVLGQVRHPLFATDFAPFLIQTQASKAKVIALANAGSDALNAIKAAAELGITKTRSLAGLLVFTTDVHSLGLEVAQGLYLTSAWYWDLNDATRKWSRRYFDKMNSMPTMVHAGTYSATLMYLRAVQAIGSDHADAVMAQLRKAGHSDIFASDMRVRADGRLIHPMYLLQVKKPEESKGPWDQFHVRATIPANRAFQPLAQSRCALLRKR